MNHLIAKNTSMSRTKKTVLIILLAVLLGCICWLIAYHAGVVASKNQMDSLRSWAFSANNLSAGNSGNTIIPQFQKLRQKNGDAVAWIKIDGTSVNYPVMQTPQDSEYYLHRNFNKQSETRGLPFLDAKSDLKKSKNYLVYGHNMRDGTEFADTIDYLHEDYYHKHPMIHFDTLYGISNYKIISVFRSQVYRKGDNVFKYYKYPDIETESDFNTYVDNVKKMSEYSINESATFGDQLLTLSTCYNYVEDGRLVIVAKRVA